MRDIYFDLRHRSVEGRSHKTCWLTVTVLSEAGSNDPWPVFSVLWVSPRRSLTLSIYLWHPICTDSLLAKTCVYNLRRKCLLQKSPPGRGTMKLMDERSDTNRLINSQPLCKRESATSVQSRTFHPDQSHSRHNIAVWTDYFFCSQNLKISRHVCSGRVKKRLGFVCGSIKLC